MGLESLYRGGTNYCGFLNGGSPVWATRKLQTLQNNGLRICEQIRDPRGVDIAGLHTALNVSTIATTRNRQLLSLLHKRSKNEEYVLPRPRVLRGNDKIQLKGQRVKKDIYERSPLCRGLQHWNNLDAATQHLENSAKFLDALKKLPDAPLQN